MYRLIALDVDGTLLRPDHTLSPRVRRALHDAQERGIIVCLATGKIFPSIRALAGELGLIGPQIVCNGAAIADAPSGGVERAWALTPAEVTQARRVLATHAPHLAIAWYTPGAILTDAAPGPAADTLDAILRAYHEPIPVHVPSLAAPDVPAPLKLLMTDEPAQLDILRRKLEPALEGTTLRLVRTSLEFLEIMPLHVSKGVALREILARRAIPREAVVAVGDGENDIPLLAEAGLAVAMANAQPDVRAHANRIAASNADDGVALLIEDLLGG
ncbi:MAG: Cof-type HAD-IIB family hydrolase [Ktedonobacterales bacterium]